MSHVTFEIPSNTQQGELVRVARKTPERLEPVPEPRHSPRSALCSANFRDINALAASRTLTCGPCSRIETTSRAAHRAPVSRAVKLFAISRAGRSLGARCTSHRAKAATFTAHARAALAHARAALAPRDFSDYVHCVARVQGPRCGCARHFAREFGTAPARVECDSYGFSISLRTLVGACRLGSCVLFTESRSRLRFERRRGRDRCQCR